jgi:hypothetical protein
MIKKILLILIFLVVAFGIYTYFSYRKGTGFISDFHTDLRTKAADYTYKEACSEFKQNAGLSEFKNFQKLYRSISATDLDFGEGNITLEFLNNKYTAGVGGTFVSAVYRTGSAEVGVVLKAQGDSYCILGIELQQN